jgi:hypothetical protein
MTNDGEFQVLYANQQTSGSRARWRHHSDAGAAATTPDDSCRHAYRAGGIIGVASKSTATSLRVYNGHDKYNEWVFVAQQVSNRAGAPTGSQTPTGGINLPGGPPGGIGGRGRGGQGQQPGGSLLEKAGAAAVRAISRRSVRSARRRSGWAVWFQSGQRLRACAGPRRTLTATMKLFAALSTLVSLVGAPAVVRAQDLPAHPITPGERAKWVGTSVYGPRSLTAGVFVAGIQTYTDWPEEWEHSWRGFGRRYVGRDAAIATSNSIEAALGSAWAKIRGTSAVRATACAIARRTRRSSHSSRDAPTDIWRGLGALRGNGEWQRDTERVAAAVARRMAAGGAA